MVKLGLFFCLRFCSNQSRIMLQKLHILLKIGNCEMQNRLDLEVSAMDTITIAMGWMLYNFLLIMCKKLRSNKVKYRKEWELSNE